ncbi:MAG: hypothetical protein PHD78_04855 [Bacilli bacterium]|nr:hypothetical protein [Bacilli bacterium]MDD4054107.1 hypothetical protein [Bacilli bacterium]MDD4411898.1 hypothetical protein [Bacilli bacterium]
MNNKKKTIIIIISIAVITLILYVLYSNRSIDILETDHITIKYNERGVQTAKTIRGYEDNNLDLVEPDTIKEIKDEKTILKITSNIKKSNIEEVELAVKGQVEIDFNNGAVISFDTNNDLYVSLSYKDKKNRDAIRSHIIKISPSFKEYIDGILELEKIL